MTTTQLVLVIVAFIILFWCVSCDGIDINTCNTTHLYQDVDVYLFWTGGFDSTFRLCELLIDQNKVVQPIYIVDQSVDGIPGGQRKSWKKEIETMDKIIDIIHHRYPHTQQLLRPTLYMKDIQLDRETVNTMTNLHHLGFTTRSVNQWAYMAQIMRDLRIIAEVGLIDEDHPYLRRALENSIREIEWGSAIKPNCAGMYDNHKFVDKSRLEAYWFNKLNYAQEIAGTSNQPQNWTPINTSRSSTTYAIDPKDESLKIFHNMQFPLYNLRKNDLINYANKQGYGDILTITWSCWNPTLLGEPCGRCEMCKDRVV